ncbi:hypothetical protein P5673_002955 [Acropora cervicornis]|uniref:Uncharacterized protein n=2 Tax=Acropora TaxID=6127 RepID=A0AAD9VEM5_ACRCE|nr:hypothetical protein P5673_002955 [Acropora cervicornis]
MLQDHVNFGEHGLNVQPQEGIYDRLRRQWAYKFSTLSLTDYSRKEKKQPAGQERASPKEVWKSEGEGWALQKPRGGSTRFSETVKSFLKDRFNAGAQTGRKADPAQVSADIRKEFEDRLKWKHCKLCRVQMAMSVSTLTHVRGKRHQLLLMLKQDDGVEENFIAKGSLPALNKTVPQKPIKPCSFDCVEDPASNFDDLIKCAKWMDRRFPPRYAAASTKSRKTCNVIYSKYAVNLPGAFRPRMTPSGLWEYKQCYLNEGTTRPMHSGLVFSAGGETESAQINSADLALDDSPFDFGATCRMYKGSLKRNGVSFDVACK